MYASFDYSKTIGYILEQTGVFFIEDFVEKMRLFAEKNGQNSRKTKW